MGLWIPEAARRRMDHSAAMTPAVRLVWQQGGFATRAQVVAVTGRAEFDGAVRRGELHWISHGRYGLPTLGRDVVVAHGVRGVLSHQSAAMWHGWAVKAPGSITHVTVPRRRRVAASPHLAPHFTDLEPSEVVSGICTSVSRTLLDCLRTLPPDEALAIADSALRDGVPKAVLDDVAAAVRGPGRPAVLRAAEHADGRAANPFESCLRSIALEVRGLDVRPQVEVRGPRQTVRPDLVDVRRRVILEADSFGWHGDRAALRRDARRYNLLVVDGWLVLRFAWEDVMFDRDYVRDVLQRVADARARVPRRTG